MVLAFAKKSAMVARWASVWRLGCLLEEKSERCMNLKCVDEKSMMKLEAVTIALHMTHYWRGCFSMRRCFDEAGGKQK